MDGYFKFKIYQENKVMDMLSRVSSIIILMFMLACTNHKEQNNELESNIKSVSINQVGVTDYNKIISNIQDSIKIWKLNKTQDYIEIKDTAEYIADSLVCINTTKDRLITCLLERSFLKPKPTGGITFLFGEKIDGKWFFFNSSHIFIPNEMKRDSTEDFFSYKELHHLALKEVYGGYLDMFGNINEVWFTGHFEHNGWGSFNNQRMDDWCFKGKRYTDKKEYYKACHMCKVKTNWLNRDTTQPIKQLPVKDSIQL